MKTSKKLFRPRNTHWRNGQYDAYSGPTPGGHYRWERHTKRTKLEIKNEVRHARMRGNKQCLSFGVYDDYTPLYMFLEKSVGRVWSDVWKEALEKSAGNYQEIQLLVCNINKNGLRNPGRVVGRDGIKYSYRRIGESSYYTNLIVDENGILQKINPNARQEFLEEHKDLTLGHQDEWELSFDGVPVKYPTIKQITGSGKKSRNMKGKDKNKYKKFDEDLKNDNIMRKK